MSVQKVSYDYIFGAANPFLVSVPPVFLRNRRYGPEVKMKKIVIKRANLKSKNARNTLQGNPLCLKKQIDMGIQQTFTNKKDIKVAETLQPASSNESTLDRNLTKIPTIVPGQFRDLKAIKRRVNENVARAKKSSFILPTMEKPPKKLHPMHTCRELGSEWSKIKTNVRINGNNYENNRDCRLFQPQPRPQIDATATIAHQQPGNTSKLVEPLRYRKFIIRNDQTEV